MKMEITKEDLVNKINDESFITQVAEKYFNFYDKNGNGSLEKKELIKIMNSIAKTFYGCEPEKGAIEEQFEKLDKDKNNTIDFNEFKSFIQDYIRMLIEF